MSLEAMTWAHSQSTGSPTAKLVLLLLANECDPSHISRVGIDKLAERAEVHRRTALRTIAALAEAGLVAILPPGDGVRPKRYQLRVTDVP